MDEVERYSIENFGPIVKADIELNNFTVFIGPQSTGKTLVSQLIFFLRNFREYVFWNTDNFFVDSPVFVNENSWEIRGFLQKLAWWYGDNKLSMISNQTKIFWEIKGKAYGIDFKNHDIKANEEFLKYISDTRHKSLLSESSSLSLSDDYIPAERIIASLITHFQFPKFPSWPGYIYKFYESLGDSLEFWSKREKGEYYDPSNGGLWAGGSFYINSSNNIGRVIEEIVLKILKGQISYDKEKKVWVDIKGKKFATRNLASGQMDFWPIWTILSKAYYSLSRAHYRNWVFIDEPEAHLHPRAQKQLVDILCLLDMSFVLTTHSPFILYSLNNKMVEGEYSSKLYTDSEREALNELYYGGTEEEFVKYVKKNPHALAFSRPGLVNAYNFSNEGFVKNIIDPETELIREEYLEEVARELEKDFNIFLEELS